MKIAYVVPTYKTKGGIQEFAKSVSSNLPKSFEVTYFDFTYGFYSHIDRYLQKLPNSVGAFLFSYIFSYYFRKKYNFNNYDLLHFWHIDAAMPFTDKKCIITCHGLEILPSNIFKYKKVIYKKVLENALYITADSIYTKNLITDVFQIPEKKIKIITPGVDTKKFDKKEVQKKKIIIGSLARFVERKNFLNIIRALEYLKKTSNIDFNFLLAGNGPQKDEILNELNKSTFNWKYLGEISEEEKITQFYPSLDLFVLPTLALENSIEGFGIVYIEANSAGVPVIASAVGGVPDAVKENISGFMCNPTDIKNIAETILKAITQNKLDRKAIKEWASKHDISKVVLNFQKVYSD